MATYSGQKKGWWEGPNVVPQGPLGIRVSRCRRRQDCLMAMNGWWQVHVCKSTTGNSLLTKRRAPHRGHRQLCGSYCCLLIVLIIIMRIRIIALKSAVRYFSQSPHCAADCLQHVHSSGRGAIVCKSRATLRARITCNMSCATWYEGTAQLLSFTDFKSHLFNLFYWLINVPGTF